MLLAQSRDVMAAGVEPSERQSFLHDFSRAKNNFFSGREQGISPGPGCWKTRESPNRPLPRSGTVLIPESRRYPHFCIFQGLFPASSLLSDPAVQIQLNECSEDFVVRYTRPCAQ
jgi:hypothetical protein